RVESPDVVAAKLGERKRMDRRSRRRKPVAIGPANELGSEVGIVADDGDEVLGDGDVRFDRRDADRKRAAERGERVLRREATRAAVTLEVEREQSCRVQ